MILESQNGGGSNFPTPPPPAIFPYPPPKKNSRAAPSYAGAEGSRFEISLGETSDFDFILMLGYWWSTRSKRGVYMVLAPAVALPWESGGGVCR